MIVPNNETSFYRMKTLNSRFNGAFLDYLTKILYENEINHKKYHFKFCEESVMSSFTVAYMRKNHFLSHEINQKIDNLKSNGLLGHWIDKYMRNKRGGGISVTCQPTKMSLESLLGAFDVLGYGLLISTLGFILEIIRSRKFVNRETNRT